MELLAFDPVNFWWFTLWPILRFVIGLGLVVFVHELGHFIVAKKVGIKVERFALGFGKRLFGVKIGETDYCINILPLGGYVKMLGQEDFKPLKEGDTPDPRAFDQKSVGARMAVISAGVVMNIIFAAILFIIIGLVGIKREAPVVGMTVPGSPAATTEGYWVSDAEPIGGGAAAAPATSPTTATGAQLRPSDKPNPWQPRLTSGDRILEVNGPSTILWMQDYKIHTFPDIAMASALGRPHETYDVTFVRERDGLRRTGKVKLGLQKGDGLLTFGVHGALDTSLAPSPEYKWHIAPFQANDRVVAVNGKATPNSWDIMFALEEIDGTAKVPVTVLRDGKEVVLDIQPRVALGDKAVLKVDGSAVAGEIVKPTEDWFVVKAGKKEITVKQDQVGEINILGMQPLVQVDAVLVDSSADKGGMKPGDIILDYGDQGPPDHRQLLEISQKHAGQKVQMTVLRDGKEVTLTVTPKSKENAALLGFQQGYYQEQPLVGFVDPASPAAKAKYPRGGVSRIVSVDGQKVSNWAQVYHAVKSQPGKEVVIAWEQGKLAGQAKVDKSTFNADAYSFDVLGPASRTFDHLTVEVRHDNPLEAVAWGGQETLKLIVSSYASIRSLIAQDASLKQASGPLGMGLIAVKQARRPFIEFVYFIAFISAAVAVFNFLPLPVVDGGHAVFLIIEKIRKKPVPVKVMNWVQMIGLVLLIALFLYITFNDVLKIRAEMW